MDHATTYSIGNYQHARTETATAAAQADGRLCKVDAENKRRKRGGQGQAEVSTDRHVADGFLKAVFLPKLKTDQSAPVSRKTVKTERDFYRSLSRIAEHYVIFPMQTQDFGYPYNIALAMWDMEARIKRTNADWDSFRLIEDSGKTFLVSEERYDTRTTLYYIPVAPLYQMLHDPKRKKNAHLLVSACSYLYHIADIPYYRQSDSYLYWMYEMMADWVEQDDETEQTQMHRNELGKAELIGDAVEQRIFNRTNLQVFGQRLDRFKVGDVFDKECHKLASDAFMLFSEYPKASIFRNAPVPEQDDEDGSYENEVITMEKYISFVSDTKGWLYQSISDTINSEFNEYGAMDEPTLRKSFEGSDIPPDTLDFEKRLFALLDDICSLLNGYQTTRT